MTNLKVEYRGMIRDASGNCMIAIVSPNGERIQVIISHSDYKRLTNTVQLGDR